ncbi:MAG: DUF4113 domain-containing protein [Chromatiaceae bacterium]|nr:DUF4113 domain-containing protein [Chromatiaceae bacterium]MBP9603031.1 DUF4113 domain-containing protein [Chromatiaceae bacterium]
MLDGVNGRWGRGTLRYLAEGGAGGQPWRMRRERLSPADTTRWEALPGGGGSTLAGRTRRAGLGELLGIVSEERDVAATGRRFQPRPIENPDVTPNIADQAALLQRPRSEGDPAPAHPQQGRQDFMG